MQTSSSNPEARPKRSNFISNIIQSALKAKSRPKKTKKGHEVSLKSSTLVYIEKVKKDPDQKDVDIIRHRNGVYAGEWKSGMMHGYGRIIKENFSVYEGFFYQGTREGVGVEILSTQEIYIGQFRSDYKHGVGLYLFNQGGFYYGFFSEGKREGFGVLVEASGRELYRGFWVKDKKHGRGVEMFENGAKYDGYFKAGVREGVGMMEFCKDLTYIGQWEKGKRHGKGIFDGEEMQCGGAFFEDAIVELERVNPAEFYDQLMKISLPKNLDQFFKATKYSIKKKRRKSVQDMETLLKMSLPQLALHFCLHQESRLRIFLWLRSLLGHKTSVDAVISKIHLLLAYQPHLNFPVKVWPPRFDELLAAKKEYSWKLFNLKEQVSLLNSELLLSRRVSRAKQNLLISASEENLELLVTNRVFKGSISNSIDLEAANSPTGADISFYERETGARIPKQKRCVVCPYFLLFAEIKSRSDFEGEQYILQKSRLAALKKKKSVFIQPNDPLISSNSKLKPKKNPFTELTKTLSRSGTGTRSEASEIKASSQIKTPLEDSLLSKNLNNILAIYDSESEHLSDFERYKCNILVRPNMRFYKGEFFFEGKSNSKRQIWMLFEVDNQNCIYSVGRDSVGPFVLGGNKRTGDSALIYQKYFEDYEITYDCFYFSEEAMNGTWSTTNLRGRFYLKRHYDFSLHDMVSEAVQDLGRLTMTVASEPKTIVTELDIHRMNQVRAFKGFLANSILSVVIHGSQGGLPTEKKQNIDYSNFAELFNRYKNVNILSEDENSQPGDILDDIDKDYNSSTRNRQFSLKDMNFEEEISFGERRSGSQNYFSGLDGREIYRVELRVYYKVS